MAQEGGFWSTLPGILTGIAAVMGAAGGLYTTLHSRPEPPAIVKGATSDEPRKATPPSEADRQESILAADREIAIVKPELESLQKEIAAASAAGDQRRVDVATARLASARQRLTSAEKRKVEAERR